MKHEEDSLQIATATMIRSLLGPGVIAWHTPNGGKRSKREAGRFKTMGVLSGTPDWTIIWSSGERRPFVLFIELKSQTGRISPEQKVFQKEAIEAGCVYAIARSLDEFLSILGANCVPRLKAKVVA